MGTEKHLQICSIAIANVDDIGVREAFGGEFWRNEITYKGIFKKYETTNVDFSESESQSGGYVTQELKAVISSNSQEEQQEYQGWKNKKCLILLNYSDGNTKMIGSKESPVNIQVSQSGTVLTTTLQIKRLSSFFAKFAKSFE